MNIIIKDGLDLEDVLHNLAKKDLEEKEEEKSFFSTMLQFDSMIDAGDMRTANGSNKRYVLLYKFHSDYIQDRALISLIYPDVIIRVRSRMMLKLTWEGKPL